MQQRREQGPGDCERPAATAAASATKVRPTPPSLSFSPFFHSLSAHGYPPPTPKRKHRLHPLRSPVARRGPSPAPAPAGAAAGAGSRRALGGVPAPAPAKEAAEARRPPGGPPPLLVVLLRRRARRRRGRSSGRRSRSDALDGEGDRRCHPRGEAAEEAGLSRRRRGRR